MKKENKLSYESIEDIVVLTPMQAGMLFHYIQNPQSEYYFEQLRLNLSGHIHMETFEKAWIRVVQNNEMLRAFFKWEKLKSPVQVILKEAPLNLVFHDLSGKDPKSVESLVEEILVEDRSRKFNLGEVPFRITLCRISDLQHVLVLSNHHILFDGWSNGIIIKEFIHAYRTRQWIEKSVEPRKNKYKEYVRWIKSQEKEKAREYWSNCFTGFRGNAGFFLKSKDTSPVTEKPEYEEYKLVFDPGTRDEINRFVREHNITHANLFYSAWGILLQKYGNCEDISFGTTVSGRTVELEGIENMVGLFINTIPLRLATKDGETIASLLERTGNELAERAVYEHTPLVEIRDYIKLHMQGEIFDTLMVIENYPLENVLFERDGDFKMDSYFMFEQTHYKLTMVVKLFDEIEILLKFDRNLYNTGDIETIADHFDSLVRLITNTPNVKVNEIKLFTEEERNVLFDVPEPVSEGLKTGAEIAEFAEVKEIVSPRNEMEAKLVEMVAEVLGQDKNNIGINSNFFELGGHSLNVVDLISRIHKEFDVQLPVTKIFAGPHLTKISENIQVALQGANIDRSLNNKLSEIPQTEKKEHYLLSSDQKRLFILQQLDPQSTTYNLAAVFSLEGVLLQDKLENSFQKLVERHESLRTSFEVIDNSPVQKVHENVPFDVKVYEAQECFVNRGSEEDYLSNPKVREIIKTFIGSFNLSRPPLFRVGIVKIWDDLNLLLISTHHLITDGFSVEILMKEFSELYNGMELPSIRIQYKDYCEWTEDKIFKQEIEKQEKYWLEKFKDEPALLGLPLDFDRPLMQSFEGKQIHFEIARETVKKLNRLVASENATLYMILLAAFNILLSKMTGQQEITIGIPTSGRRHPDLQSVVGMFTNTLVLQNEINQGKLFVEVLQQIRQQTIEAMENQDYSFEELVNKLAFKRDLSRNPLFDVMFDMQKSNISNLELTGLRMTNLNYGKDKSRFDLSFFGEEREDMIDFTVEYCTNLFKQETIERIIRYFSNIVEGIAQLADQGSKDVKVCDLNLLDNEEIGKLLYNFNHTTQPYSVELPVHKVFEKQVLNAPDVTALSFKDFHCSYGELNRRANRLANFILQGDLKAEGFIGIYMERSMEMVVSILAVLKCGIAYFPIDPSYPDERITYMLENSGAQFVLTQEKFSFRAIPSQCRVICVDSQWEEFSSCSDSNPERQPELNEPAYVIYTSGSTGKPKGVVVPHRALINHMNWMIHSFSYQASDVFFQKTPFSFDASIWEFYAPLMVGARMVIAEPDMHHNMEYLAKTIINEKVTVLQVVPSVLRLLLKTSVFSKCKSLREVFCGGEVLTADLRDEFYSLLDARLVNLYGPTEACIDATYHICEKNKERIIPIGTPVWNTTTYILDAYLKPVPQGIKGELHIGGDGLAIGYLNQPNLTSQKFIANPFSAESGSRLYKTGDMARYRKDGTIEILGRVDNQVKIRGLRVELEEIERQLTALEEIHSAVVSLYSPEEGAHDQFLCAYVVSRENLDFDLLKNKLSKELPIYMIPTHFMQMDTLPLTANGKVDRKKLPTPDIGQGEMKDSLVEELTENQKIILDVWKNVLKKQTLGLDDNFFELGGHSLKAALAIAKLQNAFAINISMKEFFGTPTVRKLSEYIARCQSGAADQNVLEESKGITETEKIITDIWIKVLECQQISSTDNFFDVGGNSLRAMVVMSDIKDSFGIDISVKEFFDRPFIGQLAQLIESTVTRSTEVMSVAEKREYYATSPAQKRMYLMQMMDIDSAPYNIPIAVEIIGEIDRQKATRMFEKMIERNEAFRTAFIVADGEPVQKILDSVDFEIEWCEINESEIESKIVKFSRPFDLGKAPLMRAAIMKIEENRHLLIIDTHHIINDELSSYLIIGELLSHYGGEELPSIKYQYKDYVQWLTMPKQQEFMKKQREYWLKRFEDEVPVLNLPIDFPRPPTVGFTGTSTVFNIDKYLTGAVYAFMQKQGITFHTFVLTVYSVLVYQYTGQDDFVIGIPVSGRRYTEVMGIIGTFVNMLPIRVKPKNGKTFVDYLAEVRETFLMAYDNQDYPFDELVRELNIPRDTGRLPIIETVVNSVSQSNAIASISKHGLFIKPVTYQNGITHFDVSWHFTQFPDYIRMSIEYSTLLFKDTTIEKMAAKYIKLVEKVVVNPEVLIEDLSENSVGTGTFLADSREEEEWVLE